MPSRKIAEKLISVATRRGREKILSKADRQNDLELARELKNICYEVWTAAPVKAQKAALALSSLAQLDPHPEIEAHAFWVSGIAALTGGKLEKTIENLDRSAAVFRRIKRTHEAAQTQVAKLIVLALLGRYEEAVATGKSARFPMLASISASVTSIFSVRAFLSANA